MNIYVKAFASVAVLFVFQAMSASANAMSLSFNWGSTPACSSSPPAFKLGAVPKGTKYLDFELVDFDAPNFRHGGGTVDYAGPAVAAGAFSYTGPCPPSGAHHYQWTVSALDAGKSELGRATATGTFPPH
jgi:phosphatidylethanolamine-binding protein (PEBP) family uncharacterized protein